MRPQRLLLATGAAATCAVALAGALAFAPNAAAQCSNPVVEDLNPNCPDQVGARVCADKPFLPPDGLNGLPLWPATATALPDPGVNLGEGTIRHEASDPRWSGSPQRGLYPAADGPPDDLVRYRILADRANPTELAVSIELTASTAQVNNTTGLTRNEQVYFGIAETQAAGVNGAARGVLINLVGMVPGMHQPVPADNITWYSYDGSTWTGDRGTFPAWISNRTDGATTNPNGIVSVWVNKTNSTVDAERARAAEGERRDGAQIVVHFKINVSALNLPNLLNDLGPKVNIGAAFNVGDVGYARWVTPNTNRCQGGSCPFGGNAGLPTQNPFMAATSQWTPLTKLGADCHGISLNGDAISTSLMCSEHNWTKNCFNTASGATTQVRVTPLVGGWWSSKVATDPNFSTLLANSYTASFKVSSWGTVGHPSQWLAINVDPVRSPVLSSSTAGQLPTDAALRAHTFSANCTNVGTSVCGYPNSVLPIRPRDGEDPSGFHQCLLAELSATTQGNAQGVTFGRAADYTNTAFEEASKVDRIARVNIKGLVPAVAGQRDVYLHVVRRNLPAHGTNFVPRNDTRALNALRAELDPTFTVQGVSCPANGSRCYAPNGGEGRCVVPSVGGGEFPCSTVTIAGDSTRYCAPVSGSPVCYAPTAGGYVRSRNGYGSTKSALTTEDKAAAAFPTVIVYPYFDSGETVTVNGQSRKKLVSMPSFGIHSMHEGDFYGWTFDLTDMNGGIIPEISPDLYRIQVDTRTGIYDLHTILEAKTAPRSSTFFQIAGTATPLGFALGNATITGTAATRTLDLSRSTVTIQKLLSHNGTELVSSFRGPMTLTRSAGATRTAATYTRVGFPTITMQAVTLPLVGQLISIQVTLADVQVPSTCPLLFGGAKITTEFSIGDGLGPVALIRGEDNWACVPGQLLNF